MQGSKSGCFSFLLGQASDGHGHIASGAQTWFAQGRDCAIVKVLQIWHLHYTIGEQEMSSTYNSICSGNLNVYLVIGFMVRAVPRSIVLLPTELPGL